MPTYREQDERMRRWYDKFAKLNSGRSHEMPSENYVDEIYAFFLNAYHLKDWIKNDPAVSSSAKDALEDYITSKANLSLCADICNSLKHFELNRSRSGEHPAFGRKVFGLAISTGGAPPTMSLKYEVKIDSGTAVDAFDVASGCIKAWDEFFIARKL